MSNKVETLYRYGEVVRTLTEAMVRAKSNGINFKENYPPIHWLQDYCTIGFTAVRQSGKSRTGLHLLEENPTAILVVRDQITKQWMLDKFFREEHNGKVNKSLADRVRIVYQLQREINRTVDDVKTPWPFFDYIIVEDSYIAFEKVRRNKFYGWLVNRNIPDPTILLIS
jgi:hypothetical protein